MIPIFSIFGGAFVSVSLMIIIDTYFNKYEHFGTLPPMTTKLNREIRTPGGSAYSVNGNYQSSLTPRFVNTNIGANIRYHLPEEGMMAAPKQPTTYTERVYDERRPQIIDPPSSHSRSSSYSKSSAHANTSAQVQKMRQMQQQYLDVTDLLPVSAGYDNQDLVNDTLNRQGDDVINRLTVDEQPIIYDRYMFANSKSRLRGRSDPFRGDLPIAPVLPQAAADSGVWFRPSVTPHIDLGRGYLSVAGGFDNESNQKLRNLMVASSGGTLQSFGGDNVRLQRSLINNSAGDLLVTAFV